MFQNILKNSQKLRTSASAKLEPIIIIDNGVVIEPTISNVFIIGAGKVIEKININSPIKTEIIPGFKSAFLALLKSPLPEK